MPFVSECPSCGQKLKVPDNLAGKRVKCSKCASVFVAESITATPPSAPPPPSTRPRDEEPEERYDDEPAKDGDDGDEDDGGERRRRKRSSRGGGVKGRGGMLMTFGIISIAAPLVSILVSFVGGLIIPIIPGICGIVLVIIGLVLGIMAWVMGSGDLKKIRAGTISAEAQGGTKTGYITGIIGTVLNLLLMLCSCIGGILIIVFGVALFGAAATKAANQQKNNPAFPAGPGRQVFQLPMPKLTDYMPRRIG